MKPVVVALLLAACHSSPQLCEPWRDVGFPTPTGLDECRDSRLEMTYGASAGTDAALRATLTHALEQHGFRAVQVRDAGYERTVLRRDADRAQVELTVTGGRVILEDNTDRVAADPAETLRALAALRASLAPLADAVPANHRTDRRCDDAALLRAEPALATRAIGFFDLDDLHPGATHLRHDMPLHDAAPTPPAATDIDHLSNIEALLPEATAARIVVGYRITRLSEPRVAGGADPTTTEGGMPTVHQQFRARPACGRPHRLRPHRPPCALLDHARRREQRLGLPGPERARQRAARRLRPPDRPRHRHGAPAHLARAPLHVARIAAAENESAARVAVDGAAGMRARRGVG